LGEYAKSPPTVRSSRQLESAEKIRSLKRPQKMDSNKNVNFCGIIKECSKFFVPPL